ncbi:MAG: membrane protein insertase YidC [Phycisphaerales bacterium]|nr:membrane protein insertase YidC [Phycisphaerales bacterium]
MNPDTRKRLITFAVLFLAGLLLTTAFLRTESSEDTSTEDVVAAETPVVATDSAPPAAETKATEPPGKVPDTARPETTEPETLEPKPAAENAAAETSPAETDSAQESAPEDASAGGASGDESQDAPVSGTLRAEAPLPAPAEDADPLFIGSLDPATDQARIEFSNTAAGIASITFSDFWTEAKFKRQAARHRADPEKHPAPPENERYTLNEQPFGEFMVPLLGARALEIDGTQVSLFGDMWSQVAAGHFRTRIIDTDTGKPVLEIERRFELEPGGYDLTLKQTIRNLSDKDADVRWIQYGPSDLDRDRGSFIEVRRFHFGYLMNATRDPSQANVLANGQMYDRSVAIDMVAEVQEIVRLGGTPTAEQLDLWPNPDSLEQGLTLSWFGATNRYFTLAVHAPYAPPGTTSKSMADAVQSVRPTANPGITPADQVVFNELHGPIKTIAAGGTANWDMGVYAGPLDRNILDVDEPFIALNMQAIIVYLMSGCCTFCTFTWLANFLVIFLAMLHDYVVFDWALAIVVLVIIVRTLLHPLLKRGQIQMQRMGKLMGQLKPELDALKAKYANDPSRMQQEQRRLFIERGVNPLGCAGGLLPTFLQMPIWIALYAVLFFAIELRQQEAFFGVFQLFDGWSFLGDLSRPDHFIYFTEPVNVYITNLTGLNILPLLMGLMFYLQQKYMSPPPSPNMTPEQMQQQKIMKIMMVVLFPVMLYQAPSGLTLYILTSSAIGIFEGRKIRKQVEKMDLTAPPPGKKNAPAGRKSGKKPKDKLGRLYAEKLEEAKQKQLQKRRGPSKNYKKRDK